MWKVGDRVLATRKPGIYAYPGTLRHQNQNRYYVIFDDGEDGFAEEEELLPLKIDSGDHVYVNLPEFSGFQSAKVLSVRGDEIQVRCEDGENRLVSVKNVRVHLEAWKQPQFLEDTPTLQYGICDRVLACGFDLDWYPAIVLFVDANRIEVLFDMGAQAVLHPDKIRPFLLQEGDSVYCRLRGGRDYFPGRISKLEGEKVLVNYDDGHSETTSVRLLRLKRDEWFPNNPSMKIAVGERVLACYYDLCWYTGMIVSVDGRRIRIAFDDGDQSMVTPDQIRPLRLEIGDRIQCRFGGAMEFTPANINDINGEKILVRSEEGQEEWTSQRMIRYPE